MKGLVGMGTLEARISIRGSSNSGLINCDNLCTGCSDIVKSEVDVMHQFGSIGSAVREMRFSFKPALLLGAYKYVLNDKERSNVGFIKNIRSFGF